MKVLIVGAGAVGSYYGAKLAKAKNDVFFIARGESLKAIKKNGITVQSVDGDFVVTPNCDSDGKSFGVADLVVVCVKAFDTSNTFNLYANNLNQNSVILSLQNGVDNEEKISSRFGEEKVVGGVAFIGVRTLSPGVVLHTAFGHITIGELNDQKTERINAIAALFQDAGIACKVSSNIKRVLYSKMLWNIGYNAICAILEASAKEVAQNQETIKTIRAAMKEWTAVARAAGVSLTDDMVEKNIEVTLKGGEVIPSMLHDRKMGRRMEIETINGKAVELGERFGVKTPVNQALVSLISFIEEQKGGTD